MVSPIDPKRDQILLADAEAKQVRGRSKTHPAELDPRRLIDGNFILPDGVLFSPAHAEHIPFLLTLPRCALSGEGDSLIVKPGSIRQASDLKPIKMAALKSGNPYDPTVLPWRGEWSETELFASVGRALSRWEELELGLASFFAAVLSPSISTLPARRAYGSIMAFKGRYEMVDAAAHARFLDASDPIHPRKSDVGAALKHLPDYSARRNEIAHGIVGPYNSPEGPQYGLALLPPEYANSRRTLEAEGKRIRSRPKYAYTSLEINYYGEQFFRIARDLQKLSNSLFRWVKLPSGGTSR